MPTVLGTCSARVIDVQAFSGAMRTAGDHSICMQEVSCDFFAFNRPPMKTHNQDLQDAVNFTKKETLPGKQITNTNINIFHFFLWVSCKHA